MAGALSYLLRPKTLYLPTPLGWGVLFALVAGAAAAILLGLYGFLAVTAPTGGQLLIVEGWVGDDALEVAIARFRAGNYRHVVTTGAPIEGGWPLQIHVDSYAALGAARLQRLGLSEARIVQVPAPQAETERTRVAARAVHRYLSAREPDVTRVDLLSVAVHARRSWRIYQEELGPRVRVGVIAGPPRDYTPSRWWTTSGGVRSVVGEALAFLHYAITP